MSHPIDLGLIPIDKLLERLPIAGFCQAEQKEIIQLIDGFYVWFIHDGNRVTQMRMSSQPKQPEHASF